MGGCTCVLVAGGFQWLKKEYGRIVETPGEARQAEPGPSILAILVISVSLAVLILWVVWYVFFRT